MLMRLAEDEGRSHCGIWWEGIPGRGKRKCKGPEVGLGWPGLHKMATAPRGPSLVRTLAFTGEVGAMARSEQREGQDLT